MYGQLFLTKNGSKDNGMWFKTLNELTPKALESGMDRLRNLSGKHNFLAFPPICLEFKALCQAYYEDLRLPSSYDAYREIQNFGQTQNHIWSHPLVEYIANRLPDDFYSIDNEQKATNLFKTLYEDITDLVKEGHAIPEIKNRPKQQRPRTLEVAKSHLRLLKQHLGV